MKAMEDLETVTTEERSERDIPSVSIRDQKLVWILTS